MFWFRRLAFLRRHAVLALGFVILAGELAAQDWRTASRAPAGLAPDPATTPEAVVQVYQDGGTYRLRSDLRTRWVETGAIWSTGVRATF